VALDVTAEQSIDVDPGRAFAYATDPKNDPVWIGGISEAELLGDPPLEKGSAVRRLASFMGRRIEYVLEVAELEPGARLAMRSLRSPFPMAVTYSFEPAAGGTVMRIRVEGEPGGMYRLAGPLLPGMVRRSVASDLRRLKAILES
jgi:Polyketide cyclase / dehydrase and lipid transport